MFEFFSLTEIVLYLKKKNKAILHENEFQTEAEFWIDLFS